MGGKALKNCTTVRLDLAQYNTIKQAVVERLECNPSVTRIHPLKAYNQKQSFGDLDVLYTTISDVRLTKAEIQKLFPDTKEIACNSDVISLEYEQFQVDLMFSKNREYRYACEYFNWNDCGNLVGRLASVFGLKHGHRGLLLPISYQTIEKIGELELTTYYTTALSFLDLSVDRYHQGFDTLEDIFLWISKSKYFYPSRYSLENLNHNQRTRDSKRPTYSKFLNWIDQQQFPNRELPPSKEEMFDTLIEHFPWARAEYLQMVNQFAIDKLYREALNGRVICTELGIAPGRHITELRRQLVGTFLENKEIVITMSQARLGDAIRKLITVPPELTHVKNTESGRDNTSESV